MDVVPPAAPDVVLMDVRMPRCDGTEAALFLGEATVKTYLSRMLTKLDLRDQVQAVAFAVRSGLVPLHPSDP